MLIAAVIMLKVSLAQQSPQKYIPNRSFERDKAEKPKLNSADYYLQKSSTMQSTAWKLASLGGVLGISGILLYSARNNGQNQIGGSAIYEGGGGFLMITGTFLVLTSIPVYFESVHYKKKGLAMTASLNIESIRDITQMGMLVNHYPALAIQVHL